MLVQAKKLKSKNNYNNREGDYFFRERYMTRRVELIEKWKNIF